ncbi:MAG: hypothetical protein QNJ53_14825 [Pleurocapsa sp. MO_192.B19]|nr:hypothetical protein [Pleurocapsa sp. MO_192.B19]
MLGFAFGFMGKIWDKSWTKLHLIYSDRTCVTILSSGDRFELLN